MPRIGSVTGERKALLAVSTALLCPTLLLSSCGGNSSSGASGGSSTTTTTTNAYATAYKSVTWASGVTVSFPSSCSMTVTSSGVPPSHNAYYLTPAMNGATVVATTPSGIQLAVSPYANSGLSTVSTVSATFNICPSKASNTTATSGGAIGVITSGEVLFDPYEATNTVALADDVSYTFTSGVSPIRLISSTNATHTRRAVWAAGAPGTTMETRSAGHPRWTEPRDRRISLASRWTAIPSMAAAISTATLSILRRSMPVTVSPAPRRSSPMARTITFSR